jgi:YggT family protein
MTTALIAAINRVDVADYLRTLLTVYIVLIFIRIVMSWFTRIPYNRYLDLVLKFVSDVTDPYLNIFRRILPPVRIGPGALDLSPIVGVLVLSIVGGIIINLIRG